jgi:hypothetical protein
MALPPQEYSGAAVAAGDDGDASARQPSGGSPQGSSPRNGDQEAELQHQSSRGLLRSASSTGSRKLTAPK